MMFYAADYRRLALEKLQGNWRLSIAVVFVATLLGGVVGGASLSLEIPRIIQALITEFMPGLFLFVQLYAVALGGLGIAQIVIGGAVALGNVQYHLDQYDGKPLEFRTLFSKFHQFGAGLCLSLLIALYCVLWGLLPVVIGAVIGMLLDLFSTWYTLLLVIAFLIPVCIASYSYAMAYHILAEYPEMTAREAIRASREMMRGRKWELFCLNFSFIGWRILAFLSLGIGNLFLGPYVSAAFTAFYRQIKSPRTAASPALPQPENNPTA